MEKVVARNLSHHLLLGQVSPQVLDPEDNVHDGEEGVGSLRQVVVAGLLSPLQFSQKISRNDLNLPVGRPQEADHLVEVVAEGLSLCLYGD